ncbi:MAG: flagellar filament capping protein FliD [Lachnospiraceae bacterium]|nr:flagellar filament capping protein FliD [Lachnospiraceae bacterium]
MNVSLRQRQDTSFLFNSLNTSTGASSGVSGLANLVSDYNTIKNGSYNKLVKAYYKKMDGGSTKKSSSSSNDTVSRTSEKKSAAASKEYKQISSDVSSLKSSLSVLSEDAKTNLYARDEDRQALNTAVSDFVDSYNSVINDAGKSSSGIVTSRATSMTSVSMGYFKQLSAIGITLQENGTLSLDKEKLSSADTGNVSKLFSGSNTYGDKVASYAGLIESGASAAASTTTTYNAGGVSNKDYDSFFSSLV